MTTPAIVTQDVEDPESPRYIRDEVLVTLTAPTPSTPIPVDSPTVQALLDQALKIAAGYEPLAPAPAPQAQVSSVAGQVLAAGERLIENGGLLVQDVIGVVVGGVGGAGGADKGQGRTDGGQGDRRQPVLPRPALTVRTSLPQDVEPVKGRDNVQVAVDRINGHIGANPAALRDPKSGIAVLSAMPNWITSSSGAHMTGGPGTIPRAAEAGDWRFAVQQPVARWTQGRDGPPRWPVVVAVLDTWPDRDLSAVAADPRYQDNWLLQDLAAPGAITVWEPGGAHVPPRMTNADADHGLFVAGIVHSVAPHAELHLLRVLDAYGRGDTYRLLQALDYCLDLAQHGRRVVVNMSLYLLIPPDDADQDLWDIWFKHDPDYPGRLRRKNTALLEQLDEAIEQRIALLLDAGAVVVAAAGNDALFYGSEAQPKHLQPRLPADYDAAFCVVATDQDGHIARFSNKADAPSSGACVATLGGQGILERTIGASGQTSTRVVVDGNDGVVSVYSGPDIEIVGDNTTGWAYWAGTSFATPIISGLAANVLARDEVAREGDPTRPPLTPRGVMATILSMAPTGATDPSLGCPYVPVTQQR